MTKISASELVSERAGLLVRLKEIEKALALLEAPGRAVEIRTHRNLRNTYLGEASVYSDASLTTASYPSDHGGWVTAEDAAHLHVECAEAIEDGDISVLD